MSGQQLWPDLPLAAWSDTCETLHRWTQIAGKTRLKLTPLINHWWNVTFYAHSRGLVAPANPYAGGRVRGAATPSLFFLPFAMRLIQFPSSEPTEIKMKELLVRFAVTAIIVLVFDYTASAQDFDPGKSEYQSSCATCHGTDAKGNGPITPLLKVEPPDLTSLAKKNNGVFPFSTVYQVVDGRQPIKDGKQPIKAHGPRDMPIWGNRPGSSWTSRSYIRSRSARAESHFGYHRLSKSNSRTIRRPIILL